MAELRGAAVAARRGSGCSLQWPHPAWQAKMQQQLLRQATFTILVMKLGTRIQFSGCQMPSASQQPAPPPHPNLNVPSRRMCPPVTPHRPAPPAFPATVAAAALPRSRRLLPLV